MSGVKNTVQSVVQHPARAVAAGLTGGISEAFQNNPFGAPLPFNNPLHGALQGFLGQQGDQGGISGPFSLDPNQLRADQAAISGLGAAQQKAQEDLAQKQYDEFQQQMPETIANQLKQQMPMIAESANAGHVLDSSAYPQEIARQQAYLTQNLALPAFQQLQQQKAAALQAGQGFQQSSLQRGLGLEDFINQANVAKTIGAQMAPQAPSSKSQFGTAASGVGALAPWGKLLKGGDSGGGGGQKSGIGGGQLSTGGLI